MNKKIILCICLVGMLLMLVGCENHTITDEFGRERVTKYGLVVIRSYEDGKQEICYDLATKVCYLMLWNDYRLALSPYYIMSDDGKPEIAVYGVNFK